MLALILAVVLAPQTGPDHAAVERLVKRCRESRTWSLLVLRDGKPVVSREFGPKDELVNLMSATKSIASLAIGMLIDEGRISSVDEKVQRFFPTYKGEGRDDVTIRMLLTHTSGIQDYIEDPQPPNRVAAALRAPVIEKPGSKFEYNNRAVDLLSGVVRRAAAEPMDRYVNRKLFKPLGIKVWNWEKDADGNPHGSAELALLPAGMAKIGQLVLQGGRWKGKQIVSKRYIDMATTSSNAGVGQEYGLLWWLCRPAFTFDESSMTKLSDLGWPNDVVQRLKPLKRQRWPGYRELGLDIIRQAGGTPYLIKRQCNLNYIAATIASIDRPSSAIDGFYANGWGGQWILVLPKQKLVAVRTCGEEFPTTDDSPKYELADFYGLVRALYK